MASAPPAAGDPLGLNAKLVEARHQLVVAQGELRKQRAELDGLRRELIQERARAEQAETDARTERDHRQRLEQDESSATESAREEASRQKAEKERALEELSAAKRRIEELEAELLRPGSTGDDLTKIKGIGAAFERALKAAGIKTYAEIAAFGDADIERAAKAVGIKPERILRADWVGSAKRLVGG